MNIHHGNSDNKNKVWNKVKKQKMSIAVTPYLLIGIVIGPLVCSCCNPMGNAPDIAKYSSNNVFFW